MANVSELSIVVYVLGALYFLLSLIPLVQLLRIQLRVPDLGWTTQKLFLCLTLISSLVRCGFFAIVPILHGDFFMVNFEHYPVFTILDTLPSILFFSTYTLLILFWAEIINHARNPSSAVSDKLRPIFVTINLFVYLLLVGCWLLLFFLHDHTYEIDIAVNVFLSILYICSALGFVVYGGRLYRMLKEFPIESRGRSSKLREVAGVTWICMSCFIIRAGLLIFSTADRAVDVNDIFIGSYYFVVEILPSVLVLFILRKIPPKKDNSKFTTPVSSYSKLSSNTYEKYGSHYNIKVDVN